MATAMKAEKRVQQIVNWKQGVRESRFLFRRMQSQTEVQRVRAHGKKGKGRKENESSGSGLLIPCLILGEPQYVCWLRRPGVRITEYCSHLLPAGWPVLQLRTLLSDQISHALNQTDYWWWVAGYLHLLRSHHFYGHWHLVAPTCHVP